MWTALLCFVGLSLVTYITYQTLLHPLSGYSGPFLAKLTNLHRLYHFLSGTQHQKDVGLHAVYGPIVRDGPNSLLIADPEMFRAVYGFRSPPTVQKGPFYNAMWNHDVEEPNLFAAGTEAVHRRARKRLVQSSLQAKHVAEYMSTVKRNLELYLELLAQEVKATGGRVNIIPALENFNFDALTELTYGTSLHLLNPPLGTSSVSIYHFKAAAWPLAIVFGYLPWLGRLSVFPWIQRISQKPRFDAVGKPMGISSITQWAHNIVSDAVTTKPPTQPCVLRNLLATKTMSPTLLQFECFNNLFAGSGSITAALAAIFHSLAQHPEWQARVLTDQAALTAVIKETLRLHPPFPSAFERVAVDLPGVPVGTRVWGNGYVLGRSEEVWGPDAGLWRPERWSEKDAGKNEEMAWAPFGKGSRQCVGRELAWKIMEEVIKAVVGRWKLATESTDELDGLNYFEMRYESVEILFSEREGD